MAFRDHIWFVVVDRMRMMIGEDGTELYGPYTKEEALNVASKFSAGCFVSIQNPREANEGDLIGTTK